MPVYPPLTRIVGNNNVDFFDWQYLIKTARLNFDESRTAITLFAAVTIAR